LNFVLQKKIFSSIKKKKKRFINKHTQLEENEFFFKNLKKHENSKNFYYCIQKNLYIYMYNFLSLKYLKYCSTNIRRTQKKSKTNIFVFIIKLLKNNNSNDFFYCPYLLIESFNFFWNLKEKAYINIWDLKSAQLFKISHVPT
jgi:hypothetical protein